MWSSGGTVVINKWVHEVGKFGLKPIEWLKGTVFLAVLQLLDW
jgi:hypothetical protein